MDVMVNDMTIDNQEKRAQEITPIARLAVSIRRERERLNLSVTELAKRAGLAKSTLSQLETGIGNPSLETLWALAMALDVQVSQLIGQPRQHVQVIRANEGAATYSEQANYAATLLAACPAGAQRDIYRLKVQPGEARVSQPHRPGTIEHVILSSGRARIGPVTQPVELSAGDYISYSADVPHLFDALEADTSAVMLIEHG
ncbi:helix-turn-helix transcriptional regulator [Pectobacterium brasiliense]|uniref:Helix-turn-helix transcriptional regulator n=2 Tax=Pectobacteriaceae TaxID=1903410 RepID=A0A7T0HWH0_9GAMM|nr:MULTISPECIES: XRE family transcriptional regulator [Pectobacterium]MBN3048851.1 helix-turn-helix transcriptional regulator [Pectobacterium brasiliense]MBN3078080.1 helix-turn-helix transcriptional regulator [Pectobacterium brasiliense]MBN3087361.1 helix-turn-helix transcriptional regulator [Pectobacterium brasiliense]MBN3091778.1 helix-turn-helix transcriptional regulator [Pectobacterium brasiliense]MBN3107812.1 helix-turn-helix transcriptional regulator [Pectobacterium brasiliense]